MKSPPPIRSRQAPTVKRVGMPRGLSRDVYHYALVQSWTGFYAILVALYLLANVGFATLYWLQPGGIADSDGSWGNAFYFSIETMATVGYGVMHPVSLYTHLLTVVEILFGVLTVPVATGLTIVKFARPSARVLFSNKVVVSSFEGVPTMMFRVANSRNTGIVEAHIKITLLRAIRTVEGHTIRRLIDMPLLRDNNPMFGLSWTLMHRMDEGSPFHGMTSEDWLTDDLVITCVITGIDETSSANVHARYTYYAEDVAIGHTFLDIIKPQEDGSLILDFAVFHEVTLSDFATIPTSDT